MVKPCQTLYLKMAHEEKPHLFRSLGSSTDEKPKIVAHTGSFLHLTSQSMHVPLLFHRKYNIYHQASLRAQQQRGWWPADAMAAGGACGAHGRAEAQQPKRSTAVCRGRGHVGSRWRAEATAIAELDCASGGGIHGGARRHRWSTGGGGSADP